MDWHYVTLDNQKEQTTEENLKSLFDEGKITHQTLVWNESMNEWTPYSTAFSLATVDNQDSGQAGSSALAPVAGLAADPSLVKHLSFFLAKNSKWMKFVGVVWFVMGILYCVTIIYAIFGWVFIWQGRILMQASDAINHANATGDLAAFERCQERISLAIQIMGILTMIGLILTGVILIVYLIIIVVALGAGAAGAASGEFGLSG